MVNEYFTSISQFVFDFVISYKAPKYNIYVSFNMLCFSGVHHKKAQCDTEKVVKKVQTILEKANPFLYPKNLIITTVQPKKNMKLPKGKFSHWYLKF